MFFSRNVLLRIFALEGFVKARKLNMLLYMRHMLLYIYAYK